MDWRDLRIVLAVDRHGSLGEAGRALRIDPTTVSRRVSALEEALGVPLFTREGWRPTDAGRRVVEAAARMAQEVRALTHDIDSASSRIQGTVRITTLDYVASWFLAPRLRSLRDLHPDLVVELRCTDQVLDLHAGQADIALRLMRPTEAGTRIRRLFRIPLGLYGARDYVEPRGWSPLPPDAPADLVIIGPPDSTLAEAQWLRARVPAGRVAAATTDVATAYELVARGVGLGVLATAAGDANPALVRLDTDAPPLDRSLWRAVPESLADAPRIRAVLDWLDAIVGVGEG